MRLFSVAWQVLAVGLLFLVACGPDNPNLSYSLTPVINRPVEPPIAGGLAENGPRLNLLMETPWLVPQASFTTTELVLPQEIDGSLQMQETYGGYSLFYTITAADGKKTLQHREARTLLGPWRQVSTPGEIAQQVPLDSVAGTAIGNGAFFDASFGLVDNWGRLYFRTQESRTSPSKILSRFAVRGGNGLWDLATIDPTEIVSSGAANNKGPGVTAPQVIAVDNLWYMLYMDTAVVVDGAAAGEVAHFVLQSSTPTFAPNQTKRWTANGFVPVQQDSKPTPAWIGKPSTWLYSDNLGMFVVLRSFGDSPLELHLLDKGTLKLRQRQSLPIARLGSQYPKLVGRSNGHSSNRLICQALAIDILLGTEVNTSGQRVTKLAQLTIPFAQSISCTVSIVQQALYGELVVATNRPAALLYEEGLTVVASKNVQDRIRANPVTISQALYDSLPAYATLPVGARGIVIADNPGVLVALAPGSNQPKSYWALSCALILEDNQSTLVSTNEQEYLALPSPHALYCLE